MNGKSTQSSSWILVSKVFILDWREESRSCYCNLWNATSSLRKLICTSLLFMVVKKFAIGGLSKGRKVLLPIRLIRIPCSVTIKGMSSSMKKVPNITGLVRPFTNRKELEADNGEFSREVLTSTLESLKLIPSFPPLSALRPSLGFSRNLAGMSPSCMQLRSAPISNKAMISKVNDLLTIRITLICHFLMEILERWLIKTSCSTSLVSVSLGSSGLVESCWRTKRSNSCIALIS
uniref:Uncharacterized protein LOC104219679 n=1 Tax=Nicotiana sylvestris TaxID=4096 RepID=A0A1U7W341_NICSY|nr:PREDICTED: uncharacterized protein LOC104219679 [Nicotiana sylvestris]